MKRTFGAPKASGTGIGKALLLFVGVLGALFYGVFLPGGILFSNDGPLSQAVAQCHQLPSRFFGCWDDLVSVGIRGGPAPPDISLGLRWLLGPVGFSKFYAVISLLLLGLSAWYFFRQSRLNPTACALGGLAAILNSTFFSVACWGVAAHVLAAAMTFLAFGLLTDPNPRWRWLRVALAGFAVGMGVCEGADVGAILSVYVAAFIAYQAFTAEGPRITNLITGMARLVIVVVCAGFLAAQAIYGLVDTSIKGIAGTEQDTQTKAERWNWATQWSLPKKEGLGLIVPGLFGYRLDTKDGGAYWGSIGRSAAWDKYTQEGSQGTPPKGFTRYTGSGYYEGTVVGLLAIWAAIQCVRRRDAVFDTAQRKRLWFWLLICIGSLLLAFGRYAPFYKWIYGLPYFSTIRNPVKFLYPFSLAVVVFFAFGIDALWRKYLAGTAPGSSPRWPGVWNWWQKAARFEKWWVRGCGLLLLASMAAGLVYAHQSGSVEQYLHATQVNENENFATIVRFSLHHVALFLVFFALSAWLMMLIFSGAFAGKRARAAGIVLGVLMVADLGLANLPWITFWNYPDKYMTNPVVNFLREQPYEHRVAIMPLNLPHDLKVLSQIYQIEWLQQQFPYNNIQSFNDANTARLPEDLVAFDKMRGQLDTNKLYEPLCRAWQLTDTRYIFAPADFAPSWNQKEYLSQSQIEMVSRFEIAPKPGVAKVTDLSQLTATPSPKGRFGLFQLENVLPRAQLYGQWLVNTNDVEALKQIFDPAFDIQHAVVVDSGLAAASAPQATNSPGGTVEYVSYASKDIVLKAESAAPSVLLLNDHFDPDWKVFVDGQPAQLLRCNFLMRGVRLEPGTHSVEFKFQQPFGLLFVSLTGIVLALGMVGVLAIGKKNGTSQEGRAVEAQNLKTARRDPGNSENSITKNKTRGGEGVGKDRNVSAVAKNGHGKRK
jgi:hypothetical protein